MFYPEAPPPHSEHWAKAQPVFDGGGNLYPAAMVVLDSLSLFSSPARLGRRGFLHARAIGSESREGQEIRAGLHGVAWLSLAPTEGVDGGDEFICSKKAESAEVANPDHSVIWERICCCQ